MAFDIYQAVTDRIISAIEKGTAPWTRPWVLGADCAISYSTGKPYSILNQILLEEPGEYITFKECAERGGHVRKGEKSKIVVFWQMLEKEKTDADGNVVYNDGEAVKKLIPILKYFNVFNVNQCEGIERRWTKTESGVTLNPIEQAENIASEYIGRSGVKLIHENGSRAFYRPATDEIHLPEMKQFSQIAEYYSTQFHEMVHSTGHESRLARIGTGSNAAAFGTEDYSKEELVAEIGACVILNKLRIETEESFRNSAAYLAGWLKALKDDKKMVVYAASQAEKAVNMITGG